MENKEKKARKIVNVLRDSGHTAYFAGGCVRDKLLGIEVGDYDIATNASPERVQELFARTVPVGVQFGVVVVVEEGEPFEVATFRTDGEYVDGRRPEGVSFASAREDAERRDFTINGLFYDPAEEKVIDFVGGCEDLEARKIKAIRNARERFTEDKLRVLRAVRFAAKLNFEIEGATWEALCAMAPQVTVVSVERIRAELVKIFADRGRLRGLDLLDESGLLKILLPELEACKGCSQPPEFHPEGDVYVHTRLMIEMLAPGASANLALAVLLHDVGKPRCRSVDETGRIRFNGHECTGALMTERILNKYRFSNEEIAAVCEMVGRHMVFKDAPKMRLSRLRRFMASPIFEEEMELHRVDCTSSHADMSVYDFLRGKQAEFANEPIIPPRLLSGADLIGLGWHPGPRFREILEEAQTLQLEGGLDSRESALAWLAQQQESSRS